MSAESPLCILQISSRDVLGGAERVALELHRGFRNTGHDALLAAGFRKSNEPGVAEIRHDAASTGASRRWWRLFHALQPFYNSSKLARSLCRIAHDRAEPERRRDRDAGLEDFHYPGAQALIEQSAGRFDIFHAHNLHGGYFDLRALPKLASLAPLVLTLHDAWLLSGHCAHSFDCDRWKTGCGACPDLSIYPAISRDATAENWRRKRDVFSRARVFVAAPCRWLARRVEASMLAPAIEELRVIPYGVDLNVFKPRDRNEARETLGLPKSAFLCLFAASGIRQSKWRDFDMMKRAIEQAARRASAGDGTQPMLFLALGEDAPPERLGSAEVRFVPFQRDARTVARYFAAADVYLHAARADTFPNVILEAQACGTPVVATRVGGIPEQIVAEGDAPEPTGCLVDPGDAGAMAAAISKLQADDALRRGMSDFAAGRARNHFDQRDHVRAYIDWYREILARNASTHPNPAEKRDALPAFA